MSPSELSKRCVKPGPAPVVPVSTILAPINKSVAEVVVKLPLLLVVLFPTADATPSSGLVWAIPLYSRIRMSAKLAG
jgi:hypothetical protein